MNDDLERIRDSLFGDDQRTAKDIVVSIVVVTAVMAVLVMMVVVSRALVP